MFHYLEHVFSLQKHLETHCIKRYNRLFKKVISFIFISLSFIVAVIRNYTQWVVVLAVLESQNVAGMALGLGVVLGLEHVKPVLARQEICH